MKIDLNTICLIRLQLWGGIKFSGIGFVRNSFDLIRKFTILLIQKKKKYSKNLIKINSKLVQIEDISLKYAAVVHLSNPS